MGREGAAWDAERHEATRGNRQRHDTHAWLLQCVFAFSPVFPHPNHVRPRIPSHHQQGLPYSGLVLMRAQWPATGCSVDATALDQYEALKQLVRDVPCFLACAFRLVPLPSALQSPTQPVCSTSSLNPQALPHSGPTLMRAQWPATSCSVDSAALDQYEALKQLVRGVRNARLEYGLEQARKLAAVLVVSDPAVQTALQSELPAICLLAKLDPTKVGVLQLQSLLLYLLVILFEMFKLGCGVVGGGSCCSDSIAIGTASYLSPGKAGPH